MKLDRIIEAFLPKEDKYFRLFEESATHLLGASELLNKLATCTESERAGVSEQIHNYEHMCDTTTHKIFSELHSTFVTPFDREDILELASALDDIMDFLDEGARRMVLYKVKVLPAHMKKLIDILSKSIIETQLGVSQLSKIGKREDIYKTLLRIHEYENEADSIFENAIADLFEHEKDAVEIIKMKDVYSSLERATDKCEDVANVLETIMIKNA